VWLAGLGLRVGARLTPGAGGRLHISLADSSMVKLGSDARLELPRLESQPDDGGLLRGALQVAKGAFRFTTRALGVLKRREIEVAIGPTITAGIRGTDIWGKSDVERQLLCLIEGRIEVSSPEQAAQTMDQPRTYYLVAQGQAPQPVAPVPAGELEKWAAQTELDPGTATLNIEGTFMLGLESHREADAAQAALLRLDAEGYAAEVVRINLAGVTWYRVVISGFATAAEAEHFGRTARRALKLPSPWVIAPDNL
jgi:hypothetical protein